MAFSGMKMWRQAVDQIRLMIEALEIFEKRLGAFGGVIGEEPIHAGEDFFFAGLAHDAKDR